MRRRYSHALVLAVATLAVVAAWPVAAFGHAAFVAASPEPGARLDRSPQQLVLTFTEPLNRRLSTVKLFATEGGDPIPVRSRATTAKRLEVALTGNLARGAYRLEWHTVSTEDGHALEGAYSFGVRVAAATVEHSVEQSPLARNGWIRVLARAALYTSLVLLVAALLLPVLLRDRRWLAPDRLAARLSVGAARAREDRAITAIAWAAVIAAVAATLAEAADAADGLAPSGVSAYLLTNQAGAARVMVVTMLLGPALFWARRPRASAVLAVVALGFVAASGHASAASPRLPSIVFDWVHLVTGALWLGGIGLLAIVWGPAVRRLSPSARLALARDVLPVFGRVALPAFLLVTTTGLISLVTELGHLSALWETGYGRVLTAKILLVGAIAVVSGTHALRLRPQLLSANPRLPKRLDRRHWRLIRTEPAIGLGVIAAAALLVTFPLPPRQLAETDEAEAALALCDPCPLPRPAPVELAVADRAGRELVAGWIRRRPDAVVGTVRAIDYSGRPSAESMQVLGAETTSCGTGCERFTAPPRSEVVRVAVGTGQDRYVATLPARWVEDANQRARRLLQRVQRTMRALQSVRQVERVTSGPGSFARTHYVLRAPDRMRLATDLGVRAVTIGRWQWQRAPGTGWVRRRYGSGLTFTTRSWFRWTTYARVARLLSVRRVGGRRIATLALMDEATPVWTELRVDIRSGRVLTERMATKAHFTRTRYLDFDRPQRIRPPEVPDGT